MPALMESESRRRRSSSRSSRESPPGEGGKEPNPTGRRGRRRRSRSARRLKSRLLALAFGCILFGVAGGLLALLVGERGESQGDEGPVAPLSAAVPPNAEAHRPVPVVTCPGTGKSIQHPAYAAACGDVAALKALLARPGAANTPDPRPEFPGRTPLHHAAQRGDTDMLAALLAAGADPNLADAAGQTPLHLVASTPQLRHPEFAARRLLDGGARPDLVNARGRTPIQELEADHHRLLTQQNLAKVLYQQERDHQMGEWLGPPAPADGRPAPDPEPPQETVVEVDTALGKVRIPVDAPAPEPRR